MEVTVDPKLFHDFHFRVAMPLRLPLTSRKILEEFVDIDVNTEAVAKIVQRNQYFEYWLLQEIKTLGLKENTPSIKAAIALLGMQRVRDFVCALQVFRSVSRKHPELGADGKLNVKPAEVLPYATKSEEFANTKRIQYPDMAYAAGMLFDILVFVGRELFEADKGFEEYVAEVYKHGLKAALIGFEISKTIKNFSFSKFVFAACLTHDVGKLAMALLFPANKSNSFAQFRKDIEGKNLSRDVIHFVETKRFGFTHEYYSSQMLYYYQVLRSAEKAVLFHHEPFLIKTMNKDLYAFSSIIALASNISTHFKMPAGTTDPVYQQWFTTELKDFKIDPKVVLLTMNKVGRETF